MNAKRTARVDHRPLKLPLSLGIVLTIILVAARIKYGETGGWGAALFHLAKAPGGPLAYLAFSTFALYDSLSIIAFWYGLEKESDGIEMYYGRVGAGHLMPRYRIIFYPIFVILFIAFI